MEHGPPTDPCPTHPGHSNKVVGIGELDCLPDNNHAWERCVVAPCTLTGNMPLKRSAAPNFVNMLAPTMPGSDFMQHGYAVDPVGWSFIACTVVNAAAGEGLNIHAYNYHATDVATGLLSPVANSAGGDNQVVYVGVNGHSAVGLKDIGINNHQSCQSCHMLTGSHPVFRLVPDCARR